jgi:hypothetical protein
MGVLHSKGDSGRMLFFAMHSRDQKQPHRCLHPVMSEIEQYDKPHHIPCTAAFPSTRNTVIATRFYFCHYYRSRA